MLPRGCGPMNFSGVTALYIDFSACSFLDNSSYSFDSMKLKLLNSKTMMWNRAYYLEVTLR